MSLLKSVTALSEEPVQTRPAEELWAENEGDVQTYVKTTVYHVRPLTKTSPEAYEVFYDEGGQRKRAYARVDRQDLDAMLVPVRPNQKPDAEGFTTYRDADEFEVFKYGGDTVKVDLGGSTDPNDAAVVRLDRGDYVLRQAEGDEFVYTVEKARYFEDEYARKA